MKIRRIKKLKVNSYWFTVVWDKAHSGGSFTYQGRTITIGVKDRDTDEIFMVICHELMEIVALEMSVRMTRPDQTALLIIYLYMITDNMRP